jgi:ABC-type branched-subunit amino acid transport system substrate-binding protein
MRTQAASAAIAASLALALSACGGSDGDKAADGGGGPLKIGVLASLTGPSSATFKVTPAAADARFKQYIADKGECASRFKDYQIVKADDTNTPQGALLAAQRLVQQDKVDAILHGTASFYGAATFLTTDAAAKKIPVMGGGFDGSPVYLDPTNNVFGILAPIDSKKTYTTTAELMKQAGASSAAVIAYDNPSSAAGAESNVRSIEQSGLKVPYKNLKIQYGTTDVGTIVQGILASGADSVISSINPETAFAVVGGLKQAGKEMKLISQPIGYSADLLASGPAVQAAQGVTFSASSAPNELDTPATQHRAAALKTIGNDSGIAGFAEDQGYLGADMFIYALEKAGCDAPMADVMKTLRADDKWDGGGLLPLPRDFGSGSAPTEQCSYYVNLTGKEFVPVSDKPICGTELK